MIRKDSLLYRVPVMVLSDAEDESELSHWLELGADDCLVRPIVLSKLIEKLRDLLLLGQAITTRDLLTGMLGMDGAEKEINHSLACGKRIAACYLSVADLRALAGSDGFRREDMDELVKGVAALIQRVAGESSINELVAAHVGTGYFVVVVYPDEYEKFCARLIRRFDSELGQMCKVNGGASKAFRRSGAEFAPKLSIGVIHNLYRQYRNADEVFRALANVHHEAEKAPTSTFFVCRRCQGN